MQSKQTQTEAANQRSKSSQKLNQWRVLKIGGVLLSIGAIVFTIILPLLHFSRISGEAYRKRLPFHSSAWQRRAYDSDADIMWPTRLRMVDDLLKSGLLERKSRAEVIELLGEPDVQKDTLAYMLGPERGFGVDYEWLQIHFDGKGYVRELKTVTD